jgi:spermidine/putrescine transport system permease protein
MTRALAAIAAAVYLFLHLPLAILAAFSFNSSRYTVWEGFSLKWYRALWEDGRLMEAAMNSLWIGLISTAAATAMGTLAAYAMWKRRAGWLEGSLYLSLITPEVVTGVSLLAFYQWAFRYLDLRLGMHTVILAHIAFSLAYVVVVVIARLRTMDATLEEAALDLGATPFEAFRRVTLPQLTPAIGTAALLAFAISFDDYVITSLVADVDSETLPMAIYAMARRGVSPAVNALSTIILTAIGILTLTAERWRR